MAQINHKELSDLERELNMVKEENVMERSLTVIQRVAICFAAGVVGALAVVLFSHILFELGLSATLGVKVSVSLKSPAWVRRAWGRPRSEGESNRSCRRSCAQSWKPTEGDFL